jgi:general stress protein YciG
MGMITPAILKGTCQHCGGNLILKDQDGSPYCLLCGRPYRDYQEQGRIGGLQTFVKYGKEYMAEIGRRGGSRVNQQPAQPAELPRGLGELKKLYKQQDKEGEPGEIPLNLGWRDRG